MTITEQGNLILDALKKWTANNKGRAFITGDPLTLVDELRAKPGVPAAAVLWLDESPYGENDRLGRVLRDWKIIISRGRGMKLDAGESLTEGTAGGTAMFDLVEQAREVVRNLRPEDQEGEFQLPVYKGTGLFEVSGCVLDAMEIRFALYAQIPAQNHETPTNDNSEL